MKACPSVAGPRPRLAVVGGLAVALSLLGTASAQGWTAEMLHADVAQFRQQFLARDRAYAPAARERAEARLAEIESRAGHTSVARFRLELAQIAALADNAHTLSSAAARSNASNRVPLRLAPFGDEFRVLRSRPADADLLGARLVAIDGVPLERLRAAAHTLAGGLPAWRDRSAPLLLESPEQLHALELIGSPDEAVYRLALDDGRQVERRLSAEPPSPTRPRADTHRLLLPEVTPDEMGWRGVLPLARAPWALRDALQPFRWRHDPGLGALVVQMRQTRDSREHKLEDFFAEVGRAVQQHRPRHLVLDLRHNGGGDLTRGRDFVQRLPELVAGRVYVLTSPWTFSAAITLAAYTLQAAPERVVIVGEPVGDRLEFFAEGRPIKLEHSGAALLPATERHDYVNGCRAASDCHGPVRSRPIAVPSLEPRIAAPLGFDRYRAGIDAAMEAVAAAVARLDGVPR